jgi:glycogen debranching enzyme
MPTTPLNTTVSDATIDRAIRLAIGDLASNISPYKDGLLTKPEPCLMAGLDYNSPWTRDSALNTWYGLGLLAPQIAKSTLLSVLKRDPNGDIRIGGEYWDAIIWAHGAWQYYLYTGDRSILEIAHAAVKNSLVYFEKTEFDPADGLFRGGACFQDGIAAYPDHFAPKVKAYTGILGWLDEPAATPAKIGVGITCKALSTNCLYYRAYKVAGFFAKECGQAPDPLWEKKAEALHRAINDRFWREKLGRYGYLVDAPDNDDYQEGFGLAFALLFGIADDAKAKRIFDAVYLSDHGIPCVWPTYPRYKTNSDFGRHSGTIWPQVNAAWALACHFRGRPDLARFELKVLAEKACRDSEFVEVYHPESGIPYGGLQEALSGKIESYWVCHRQSWCASGYLAMIAFCELGLDLSDNKPISQETRAKLLGKLPKISFEYLS